MTGWSRGKNGRSRTGRRRPGDGPPPAGRSGSGRSPGGRDRPGYGAPDYGAPDYGAPDYGAPDYGTPDYGTPDYGAWGDAARGYGGADFRARGDAAGGGGVPVYGAEEDGSGEYGPADYDEPDGDDAEPRGGDRQRQGRSQPGRSSGRRSHAGRAVQFSAGRLRANRLIVAGLVLAALGAVYGFAAISPRTTVGPAAAATRSGSLPVTSALLGCPALGITAPTGGGRGTASQPGGSSGTATSTGGSLALASAATSTGTASGTSSGTGHAGSAGSGQAMLTQLSPGGGSGASSSAGTTVQVLTQPGQLIISRIPVAATLPGNLTAVQQMAGGQVPTSRVAGGLVIQSVGALAQGLDAEQLSQGGLPTARCQPPGADFWFVGPGASGKPHIELYLLNTDGQTADASVGVQTDAGPWVGSPDSGITVPPYSMVAQDLTSLLQSAHAASLNVTTSSGRVVAAVRETTDTTASGAWLPPAQVPSVSQILPGLPGTSGTPEIFISVPGNLPAQVQVSAITRRGTYQPTGGNGISVLSHTTTGVSLPSLAGVAAALKVTSNVPVTVSVMLPGGPAGAPGAFITGAGPITQQSVLAASPAGTAGGSQLVLSAPKGAAKVSVIQAIPGDPLASQTPQIVQIPARSSSTLVFSLPKSQSTATAIAIVVTPLPGSGPVYAARVSQVNGNLDGIMPLISTPTSVSLPDVRESLTDIWK